MSQQFFNKTYLVRFLLYIIYGVELREWTNEGRATVGLLFWKFWKPQSEVVKKSEKIPACRKCWILPTCKISNQNSSYFELHNSLFTTYKFQIFHFCTAQNMGYYYLRLYTSVGFNIFYMQEIFQNFYNFKLWFSKISK